MHTPPPQAWEDSPLPQHLVLASQSPRRLALLQSLGVETTVFVPLSGQEAEALETPLPQEDPLAYVQRIAQLKLHTALQALQGQQPIQMHNHEQDPNHGTWVLAADTTVALAGRILGKPADACHAQAMLQNLSNATHTVHTAVAIAHLGPSHANPSTTNPKQATAPSLHGHTHHSATVHMARLPLSFIQAYIASGEPLDKAGAYGIQGCMAQYVRCIEGSHSGIVGLPLFETACLLRQLHYRLTQSPTSTS